MGVILLSQRLIGKEKLLTYMNFPHILILERKKARATMVFLRGSAMLLPGMDSGWRLNCRRSRTEKHPALPAHSLRYVSHILIRKKKELPGSLSIRWTGFENFHYSHMGSKG